MAKKIGVRELKRDIVSGDLKPFSRYDFKSVDCVFQENILHFCAKKSKVSSEIVKILCKAGADVNLRNFNDETPLYKAILYDNVDAAKVFLQQHADPNIKSKGNSCYAAAFGRKKEKELFELLWKYGAELPENDALLIPDDLEYIKKSRKICSNIVLNKLISSDVPEFILFSGSNSPVIHKSVGNGTELDMNDLVDRFLNILTLHANKSGKPIMEYLTEIEVKVENFYGKSMIATVLNTSIKHVRKSLEKQLQENESKLSSEKKDATIVDEKLHKYKLAEVTIEGSGVFEKGVEISMMGEGGAEESLYFSLVIPEES